MATRTGVVIVEARDGIEPKEPAHIGSGGIDVTAQARFEGFGDPPGKLMFSQFRPVMKVSGRLIQKKTRMTTKPTSVP